MAELHNWTKLHIYLYIAKKVQYSQKTNKKGVNNWDNVGQDWPNVPSQSEVNEDSPSRDVEPHEPIIYSNF